MSDDVIQVVPIRVHAFDQRQLFRARAALYLLLSADGTFHRVAIFEPDQELAPVFFGEPADPLAMLPGALNQVRRNARVKRPIAPTGHDVDRRLLQLLLARRREERSDEAIQRRETGLLRCARNDELDLKRNIVMLLPRVLKHLVPQFP